MKGTGNFKLQDILSLSQFDQASLFQLFKRTDRIIHLIKKKTYRDVLKGSVIALLFFEPSTRTYNSFSSAAQRLGAGVIGIQDVGLTSIAKGESFEDTIRMMEGYSDAIVIRHSEVGSAQRAADVATVPVINAGDGGNEHPTQGLLDLYTIHERFGRLHNLVVVAGPDPLHSRTIRSLMVGLSLFKNNQVYLLSPQALRLSPELKKSLIKKGLKIQEIEKVSDIPNQANVWYWNRLQKERFSKKKDYMKYKSLFTITNKLLAQKGNKNLIIMDPLPRIDEVAVEVDSDPRAYYFKQAQNGLYIRMALLSLMIDNKFKF